MGILEMTSYMMSHTRYNIYVSSIEKLVKFMEYHGFKYRVGSKGHYVFRKGEKRVGAAVI